MCGIIGYVGQDNARDIVIRGLKALEYRGYDSAGVAFVDSADDFAVFKSVGEVSRLNRLVPSISSNIGIGHTRWATHGAVNTLNCHPHLSFDKSIAIVHNGVIENEKELSSFITSKGIERVSQTDSELIAHLIALEDLDICKAMDRVASKIVGASSFIAIKRDDNHIYARHNGASLHVGVTNTGCYIASDVVAILPYTNEIYTLEKGDTAILSKDCAHFYHNGVKKDLQAVYTDILQPKECDCHMWQEINEIPCTLIKTFNAFHIDDNTRAAMKQATKIVLIGCGTAYHACMYGKEIFERSLHIPCQCVIASEWESLRFVDKNTVAIAITQSGETQDTLIAIDYLKKLGAYTIAITNSSTSAITRIVDMTINLDAGFEMSVAATKSYTSQLISLLALSSSAVGIPLDISEIFNLSTLCKHIIDTSIFDEKIANDLVLFIGKGLDYITAKEGALKMSEITYKPAFAYPSGELKHGYIALVDNNTTCIVIATCEQDRYRNEVAIKELRSRGARVIAISSIGDIGADKTIYLPKIDNQFLYSIASIIPLQHLALDVAHHLNLNPDKPRNLAKSVTVI